MGLEMSAFVAIYTQRRNRSVSFSGFALRRRLCVQYRCAVLLAETPLLAPEDAHPAAPRSPPAQALIDARLVFCSKRGDHRIGHSGRGRRNSVAQFACAGGVGERPKRIACARSVSIVVGVKLPPTQDFPLEGVRKEPSERAGSEACGLIEWEAGPPCINRWIERNDGGDVAGPSDRIPRALRWPL